MNNLIGQQWGSYRLTRLLGQGGFAEVYLAEHTRLKMSAAIKILYTHLSQEGIEAFQNEAQVIANLVHPHIVRLLDFDVKEGRPFLVLDYASNGSLRQRHAKGERLPLDLVVSYTEQIASALQFAHDQKLVHRDVKPENMLLSQQDTVLLSDFGIASVAHSTSSMNMQSSMGTLPYMAPEQIQGFPRPASDQYALGITVYQWLSGNPPFQGNSAEIIAQHLGAAVPPLRKAIPEVPADIEQVLEMALAKDPKARFGSIQAFATALAQASKPAPQGVPVPPTQVAAAANSPVSPEPVHQLTPPFAGPSEVPLAPTIAASPYAPIPAHTPPGYAPSAAPVNTPPPYAMFFPATPYQPASSSGKIAFKWGGIFGAGLATFGLIRAFVIQPLLLREIVYQFHLSTSEFSLVNLVLSVLIFGIFSFCLGMVASSKSGEVKTGVIASLWAYLWYFIVTLIVTIVDDAQLFASLPFLRNDSHFLQSLITSFIIGQAISFVLTIGIGALGSLVGRSMTKKPYPAG